MTASTNANPIRRPFNAISNSTLNRNNNQIIADSLSQCKGVKKKTPAYCRKDKSLGLLCENFMSRYGEVKDSHQANETSSYCKDERLKSEAKYIHSDLPSHVPVATNENDGKNIAVEQYISIDAAAEDLGVERRRIYDIINILESIHIVSRKCKNTYNWHGTKNLPSILAKLQRIASQLWKEDSKSHGIAEAIEKYRNSGIEDDLNAAEDELQRKKLKSLGKLSQEFLQLFLAGNDIVNLNEATEKIVEGGLDRSSNSTEIDKDRSSCWIKTKSRRLYDIANVLASIGIIARVGGGDGVTQSAGPNKHRGSFRWVYKIKTADLPRYWSKKKSNEVPIEKIDNTLPKQNLTTNTTSKTNHISQPEKVVSTSQKQKAHLFSQNGHTSVSRRNVSNLFSPVSKKRRTHKQMPRL